MCDLAKLFKKYQKDKKYSKKYQKDKKYSKNSGGYNNMSPTVCPSSKFIYLADVNVPVDMDKLAGPSTAIVAHIINF